MVATETVLSVMASSRTAITASDTLWSTFGAADFRAVGTAVDEPAEPVGEVLLLLAAEGADGDIDARRRQFLGLQLSALHLARIVVARPGRQGVVVRVRDPVHACRPLSTPGCFGYATTPDCT